MEFIDLFCGAGFGARGAVVAGAKPVLAVDCWEIATSTYADNFPNCHVRTDFVEKLNPKKLAKSVRCDILLASPECTSHSIARGARPGCDRSRETATTIVPWLEVFEPRWLIVENVKRIEKWPGHEILLKRIQRLGYRISYLLLNAADFGVPQSRKRLFLLCDRYGTETSADDLKVLHKRKRKTVRSILVPDDVYQSRPLYSEKRAAATLDRAEKAISALGTGIPFLVVYYGTDGAGGWQTLDAPLRTVTTLDRFGLVTWRQGIPLLRMLQPDELMRAMGSGSKHRLAFGTRREKIKLCGNGVCSPVVEMIVRRITQLTTKGILRRAS